MCVTLWSALLLWPQDCMHSPVLLGKNTSSPVSPSAGTGFYLGYLSSVQCASCSVCPRHPSRSSGWDAAARGDHSTADAATPAAPTCSSTASASQTAPSSLLEVSQPFTVQYNRKIQKPFPVLHHSHALFRSKSFSLLRQHCSCCTRSLTLSPSPPPLHPPPPVFSISVWRSSRDEAQPSPALPAGSELPKPVNVVQPLHLFCTLLTVCRNHDDFTLLLAQ